MRRSELDIKGSTIIGKTHTYNSFYTYELQIHGGDKFLVDNPPQACGKLDIVPAIEVTDASSGVTTRYPVEAQLGDSSCRFGDIYAQRTITYSQTLQPVDGTLDDATIFYTEKVPEPGDESGRYYDYTMYIKTPEAPVGEAWEYAIAPYQNWFSVQYLP